MSLGIRTRAAALAPLAVLAAVLTACGSDDTASDPQGATSGSAASDSPGSPSPATSDPASASPTDSPSATASLPSPDDPTEDVVLPSCESVWVVGTKLPRSYEGCLDGTTEVPADGLYCEFGKPLFTYGKHFYAVENGPVNRTDTVLAKDPAFQKAQRSCGG